MGDEEVDDGEKGRRDEVKRKRGEQKEGRWEGGFHRLYPQAAMVQSDSGGTRIFSSADTVHR